jgi:hypothetical protein
LALVSGFCAAPSQRHQRRIASVGRSHVKLN